jgi:hypothetical protein
MVAATYPTERSATCPRHGLEHGPLIAACATLTGQPAASPQPAAAAPPSRAIPHGIPKLNYGANCRAIPDASQTTIDQCLADEHRAYEQLTQGWVQFAASDKPGCIELSSTPGLQSYVQLLTCLESARDARKATRLQQTCLHSVRGHLPYQRPRPYQPPPPSKRMTNTMMRRVVISICVSPIVSAFPRTPLDALQH